jgi:hypothetical protein
MITVMIEPDNWPTNAWQGSRRLVILIFTHKCLWAQRASVDCPCPQWFIRLVTPAKAGAYRAIDRGLRRDDKAVAIFGYEFENYLECYHCAVAHASFSAAIDARQEPQNLMAHGWFSSQIGQVVHRRSKAAYPLPLSDALELKGGD